MMFRPPNCLVFYKIQGFIVKMGRRWGQDGNKLGTRWGQDVNKIGTDMMVIRQGYDRDKIRLLTLHFLDSGGGKYSIPPPYPRFWIHLLLLQCPTIQHTQSTSLPLCLLRRKYKDFSDMLERIRQWYFNNADFVLNHKKWD